MESKGGKHTQNNSEYINKDGQQRNIKTEAGECQIKERQQCKVVEFATYLPPVRAPGGKKVKRKRKRTKNPTRPETESSEFSANVLKLPPIDPNAKSTSRRSTNDAKDNDGLSQMRHRKELGTF